MKRRLVVGLVMVVGALVVLPGSPASAVACTSPVRYATTTNTIYLVTAQTFTLSSIVAACAAAPLTLVDPGHKVWELDADLVLQNGATLVLHGDDAAAPGDVNTLRIRSRASNAATEVQQLNAQYGAIDMDAIAVTSWDDLAGAPDTDPTLPAGAAATDRARAFVRALSYLDPDGVTPRQSRLDIRDSDLGYLGYYAAESYGVAYKTRGCDHLNLAVCNAVKVTGSQLGSRFHHNYMGTYTWGAYDIDFIGNAYDNNVMYGLDPHDVSTYLTITNNRFSYNGDHGVICSQLCDHLTITDNESDHNGLVPWTGPEGDAEPGQVHGIMIHRGVTNTVIARNNVHDMPNGAGIAIFDSSGNTVEDNTVARTLYGVRISVGSAQNIITGNTIDDSYKYALYMYKGSDLPSYTTMTGHPTANVFDDNTVDGTDSNALKLTESDDNVISDTSFADTGGSVYTTGSTGNVVTNSTFPSGQDFAVRAGSELTITAPSGVVDVSCDATSSADVTSPTGVVFQAGSTTLTTTATATGSTLHLTSALLGTTGTVPITPKAVTVVPAAGSLAARATGSGASTQLTVSGQPAGTTLTIRIGGLTAGTTYTVKRAGTSIGTATANGSGWLTVTNAPPSTGSYVYSVS
jgi:mannuronan 5-epimerase